MTPKQAATLPVPQELPQSIPMPTQQMPTQQMLTQQIPALLPMPGTPTTGQPLLPQQLQFGTPTSGSGSLALSNSSQLTPHLQGLNLGRGCG